MKYKDLEKFAESYRPAYLLDGFMGIKTRSVLRKTLLYIAIILGTSLIFPPEFVALNFNKFLGAFILISIMAIKMCLLEMFYYSHIFKLAVGSNKNKTSDFFPVTYDVAKIMFNTDAKDIVSGFIDSDLGNVLIQRLDISKEKVDEFLALKTKKISADTFDIVSLDETVTFADYSKSLYVASPEFAEFLLTCSVSAKMWNGISNWISRMRYIEMRDKRFWSKEMMGRVPSLGKDWAYGNAWTLMKYANLAEDIPAYRQVDKSLFVFYKNEFEALENVLVKKGGASAMLISEDPQNTTELVAMLALAIDRGYAYGELEKKRVFYLNTTVLLGGIKNKDDFENILVKILNEAKDVGNIILAVENFSLLILTAHSLGSDIVALFNIFFGSRDLHLVALSDKNQYHNVIETNRPLLQFFEKIEVKEKDKDAVSNVLEDEVLYLESSEKVFITYPAIQTIVEDVERYFSETFLYEKAKDVLLEIVVYVKHKKKRIINKEDVLTFFSEKTGIPQGEIKEEEKTKLVSLESDLRKKVIGQNEATTAVSNALRRARAGVGNTRRPIGSFLFLGPTGVGKTEMTKALASTFFGSEENILRFDMSEYKTDDALKRLIGSFEEGHSGLLSKKLRDKPYSVLLLDEFEKTNKDVHDLFLQIIDEGFFSDMEGNKVNARNSIIIATSNAGSDLIFDYVKSGENLINKKDDIIKAIVERGIFKPELINRFDGVIIFSPLKEEDLKKIAGLMLIKLESRLKEKGIRIAITDKLIDSVVKKGMDQAFGARPMNRYIQEEIESKIADKIIRGEISAGEVVSLDSE